VTTIEITRDGRVCIIALNRPEKRNALNMQMSRELLEAFDAAERDKGVGCVLLHGNGPSFCSGMDLAEAREADPRQVMELQEKLFTMISRTRVPIVASVHGSALAGGTGLAANAHVIIAAPDASFGMTEIRVGLWPVLVYRPVEMAVGERRATELCLTGRIFDANEAREYGLVSEVTAGTYARGLEVARTIASYSPVAVREGLGYLQRIRLRNWEETGRLGWDVRERLTRGADFEEGTRAFLEKRKPDWPSLRSEAR
jgi:enoyl-CoA hydratase/carnithine racemase